ncbi:condensation domain-containing protein [Nocardiopsis rhodophaea]|uniref:Condensation domain-containing protein n=1 Tax=Nocardiopsis rhodophaea TaxID=280238 RepID=A0ABN2S9M6_9ACTN
MRVTTLDRYDPAPGRVVEFVPSAATLAAADGTPAAPVPPSLNQRFHLETERRQEDGPRHWLACAFDLEAGAAVDPEALRKAFVFWVRRHETLRSGFRPSPDGTAIERFILPAEDFDLEARDGGAYATTDALRNRLSHRLDEACRALSWPSYLFATVLRPSGATVFCGFDHCNADAYSLAIAVRELGESYRAFASGTMPDLPAVGSYVDYCAHEQEAVGSPPDRDDPIVRRWAEFFAACGGTTPTFPLDLGLAPGERRPQGTDTRHLLDGPSADEFERVCEETGGSLFSGVLAAAGLAAHRLGAGDELRLCVPMHTRHDERWTNAVGWFTTVAPVTLDISGAIPAKEAGGIPCSDAFATRVHAARAGFRAARDLAQRPVAHVLAALGEEFTRTRDDVFMLSFVDYRPVPGSEHHAAANAHHLSAVTMADDAQFWVTRTHEGLFLRSRYPDDPVAENAVLSFADALAAAMAIRVPEPSGVR